MLVRIETHDGSSTETLSPGNSIWDGPCIKYATQPMKDVPDHLQPAPEALHLGFYGYLRTCNLLCLAKSGVSIFDLSDVTWRDWYDEQKPPSEAVEEALEEDGFPADD
jgi:hypothetical protein